MPLPLLLVLLPFLWLLGLAIFATMGGWRRLASRFPEREIRSYGPPAPGAAGNPRFRMASVWIGKGSLGTTYGGCGVVEISDDGVRVSTLAPFRPFHPAMFIPWSEVTNCTRDRFVLLDRTFLDLKGAEQRLRFTDPVGQAVMDRYQAGGFPQDSVPPPLRI